MWGAAWRGGRCVCGTVGGGGGWAAGPLGAPSPPRNLASVLPSRSPCSSSRPPPALPQLRARDPASRGDRYMLVTFEEPPYAIKVTALALPLPFPVPSSLPSPPPHSPFIMLPSPTRGALGAEVLSPTDSHPLPRLGASRRGAESRGHRHPLPSPARRPRRCDQHGRHFPSAAGAAAMNCGGYLFKLAPVTAARPPPAEPGLALKGNRPEAGEPAARPGGCGAWASGSRGEAGGPRGSCRLTSEVLLTSAFHQHFASPPSGY